jgi:hypothetical protein
MEKTIGKYTSGFGLALVISTIFTSLFVVLKETNKGLKEGLASILGHHWTTHGAITIILFIVMGVLLSGLRTEENWGINARKLTIAIVGGTVLGGLIISSFFLIHLLSG